MRRGTRRCSCPLLAELNEADLTLELEVRIAVNSGEALIALAARPELGEGMASGNVVNTAARLQTAPCC